MSGANSSAGLGSVDHRGKGPDRSGTRGARSGSGREKEAGGSTMPIFFNRRLVSLKGVGGEAIRAMICIAESV